MGLRYLHADSEVFRVWEGDDLSRTDKRIQDITDSASSVTDFIRHHDNHSLFLFCLRESHFAY